MWLWRLLLYMVKEESGEALEEYVKNSGTLVTSFMSGVRINPTSVYLGVIQVLFTKMAGIWVEEIGCLGPGTA